MQQLYLFAAAVGVPLVAWFLFTGGDEGGDDAGSADGGVAAVMFRLLPLSTIAFALATFGVCGLVLGLFDTGALTTLIGSLGAALVAGAFNSAAFAYLRRSDQASEVGDRHLAGTTGRVVLPVADRRRGRVAVEVEGQQLYLTAEVMPDATAELEVGAPVLVVDVERGVARVTRLDPELT